MKPTQGRELVAALSKLAPAKPDPIRAVMEAGGLEQGRKVIEWETPAGRMRVTIEVEAPP